MSDSRAPIWKRLLILPPLAIGVAVLVWQLGGRPPPVQADPAEPVRSVRVVAAQPVDFVPRAQGYGTVQPGIVWQAVAQVAGQVVWRHPELRRGQIIPAGEAILRIDPADYELAVTRLQAGVEAVEAQIAELEARRVNLQASLAIEQSGLSLAQDDRDRRRSLYRSNTVSQSAVDEAERQVLTQRQRVQDLENQINLVPAQRRLLDANLALARAQLAGAALDLERTTIRLPFDGRIAEVTAEATQFVTLGQRLAVADSIDRAEIAVQVPIDRMRGLVQLEIVPAGLSAAELAALPEQFGLSARVSPPVGGRVAVWNARFDRISDMLDPETRTVGVYVVVDEPYRQAIPGQRPPLTKNMFVAVEITGRPRPESLVVPRVALHAGPDGGTVLYLATVDDRLAVRPVTVGRVQGDLAVIEAGLRPGERVVVSDLQPAIEGMRLGPVPDAALAERLAQEAGGDGPERRARL